MILLTQLDRRGEALQVYNQHALMLEREYESEPLPETIELFEKLRQGHIPAAPNTRVAAMAKEQVAATAQAAIQSKAVLQDISFMRPIFQPGRHNQSPLIGRERELYTLHQVMYAIEGSVTASSQTETSSTPLSALLTASPSRSEHTHFLLLKGEPGIGKTRLAEELSLTAYARDWTVAWSRSYEQESSIPYHPWTEVLRTLFQSTSTFTELVNSAVSTTSSAFSAQSSLKIERLSALLPDLALLPPASGTKSPVPHEQERLHLWEAALGLIGACSKLHPLLLVLDDLHWADDSSIELLTYLVHHLHNHRVLVVGTCRDGEIAPQHRLRSLVADLQREQTIATVSILPLTHSQIGSMVAHLPQDVVHSIQAQAAGNPFFAEELARHVGDSYNDEDPFKVITSDEQQKLTHSTRTRNTLFDRAKKPSAILRIQSICCPKRLLLYLSDASAG